MKIFVRVLLVAVLMGLSGQASALGAGAKGMWLDQRGKAKMKVDVCNDGTLCARIVWLRDPNDAKGRPLIDGNNGNARLRKRPIIGLPVAYNMRQTHSNKWKGRVYDPQKGGSTYTGSMTLLRDGRMKVTGCLLFVCESQYWSPLPE